MKTKLCLTLSIIDCFTEVKHALILANILNFLLEVTKFMQTNFKVVQEIGHGAMKKVQFVNVLLINFCPVKLNLILCMFLLALGKDLLRLCDFVFEDRDVFFKHLYLEQALLSLINVNVFVDFLSHAHLTRTRATFKLIVSSVVKLKTAARLQHAALLLQLWREGSLLLSLCRDCRAAISLATRRERLTLCNVRPIQ